MRPWQPGRRLTPVSVPTPARSLTLRRVHEVARSAHPTLDVPFETFARAAHRTAAARMEKLGLAGDAAQFEDAYGRVRGADLLLAQACELNLEGAWDLLHDAYAPRLTAVARRQGIKGADAESLANEVLATLAMPPASGVARTRMGTFGGACTLAGWLAVVLTRRIAADARRKHPVSLDASGNEGTPDPMERTPHDPLQEVVDHETRTALEVAFADVWGSLTAKEQLALAAKFRDGRKQREIAALLGVGEPRVSRLVGQALRKVRAAFEEAINDHSGSWDALLGAVQRALATSAADVPPFGGGSDHGGSRDTA